MIKITSTLAGLFKEWHGYHTVDSASQSAPIVFKVLIWSLKGREDAIVIVTVESAYWLLALDQSLRVKRNFSVTTEDIH
jgi:hypothetical protein